MAYGSIIKPSDYFNNKLWTGTGAENSITGVGFQPDMTWIKQRTSSTRDHNLFDSPRGATKRIYPNLDVAEDTAAQVLKSFDSDGFTLGTDTSANQSSGTYVAWNWKAGTTSGLSGGTITPSAYSINTESKMGIYTYTGNGSGSQTIAHGLGATPTCVMFKELSGSEQWRVHFMSAPNPYSYMLLLNSNAAEGSQSNGLSAVSSTTITFGSDGAYNLNGDNYVCYIFCDVTGFSKCSSYVGNGSTNGTFAYTGFKPAFVMVKYAAPGGGVGNWGIFDSARNPSNVVTKGLIANTDAVEDSSDFINIVSNGFKQKSASSNRNEDGSTYVYMAFAENPFVANVGGGLPTTAR
tara:strand:- start:25 stop:1074 length:1050 start_codon:yes stop_codon:yes gene_type:complete